MRAADEDIFGKGRYLNAKGNAECVEFVRQTTGAPHTSIWRPGKRVMDAKPGEIPRGSAIATFDERGRYPCDAKGMHAAIYLEHNASRMLVLDQWKKQGQVKQRLIRFTKAKGTIRSDDGSTFYVIE